MTPIDGIEQASDTTETARAEDTLSAEDFADHPASAELQAIIDSVEDGSFFAPEGSEEAASGEGFWEGVKGLFDDSETELSGIADVLLGRADAFEK